MSHFSLPADFDLSDHFDHPTLMRAIGLKPDHALLSQHEDGDRLHTRLRGNGSEVYEQTISFFIDPRTGLHLRGLCTCAVGFNCMHVGAALMAHEAGLARARRLGLTGDGVVASDLARHEGVVPVVRKETPRVTIHRVGDDDDEADGRERSAASLNGLPHDVEAWLGQAIGVFEPRLETGRALAPAAPAASNKRLMYVLSASAARLELRLYLGSARRNGEVSRHHPHSPAIADMLRTRPSYISPADEALLAALLPFVLNRASPPVPLQGRTAAATLQQLLQSGACWWAGGPDDHPATPPGAPLAWVDEPLSLQLRWSADADERWSTHWSAEASEPATDVHALVLLPEPHAVVRDAEGRLAVRPADVSSADLSAPVIGWLAGMPAVAAHALPQLVQRLKSVGLAHQVMLPLPERHAPALEELGELTLQPVLRLLTCPNVPSEAWLEGHQRPPPAGQPLRQAAAQLVLRYRVATPGALRAGAASVDFNFPAGASDVAFIEQPDPTRPGQTQLTRFRRDSQAEAQATQRLFEQLELRAWSRVAAFALDRMAALKAGRLQSAVLPPALEDGQLTLVPASRDQWPLLLSRYIPQLQAEGWLVERADDFPFEVFEADDFELSLDEMPGSGTDWFRIGLKVSVAGTPVDLVPLLVGLVQGGWLKLEATLRDPDGEVLLPWPEEVDPTMPVWRSGPRLRRERLLRLPVSRVAPLVAWLRGVFGTSGFNANEPRVSRYELGALETLSTGVVVRAPPALDRLLEQLRSLRVGEPLPAVAVSPHVNAQLRPYQLEGLTWMDFLRCAGFGGVLADDMGLGKTLQALALLQNELDAGRLDRPSLVVVPTSLLENWQSEAQRFTPQLRVLVLHGKQRIQLFGEIASAHVVVTSYQLAVRDMPVLVTHDWHYLVLDEAQRIKNSRSQATVALKALNARHRLCLSGTPLENHLGELWSLMDFVSPGLLGSEAQFREHYRTPIEKRQETQQADHLARRVRPFILRRTKLQVAQDLPAKTETLLRVELDGMQRDLYETVRATMDSKLRAAIAKQGLARSQIVVLDALLKLRQVCCDPRLLKFRGAAPLDAGLGDFDSSVFDDPADEALQTRAAPAVAAAPSAKLELLCDLLPTLAEEGRRILVFSQFTEMLALIEPELVRLGLDYVKLTGETQHRGDVVRSFQEGTAPVFLISLKAGGVGLNLTAADTVILYDPWWNPAVEQQAIDRAYRIGQDKPVFVYKLVASGTVEEKMLELQARKAGLADALLSGVAGSAALTAQDFEELFKPLGGG